MSIIKSIRHLSIAATTKRQYVRQRNGKNPTTAKQVVSFGLPVRFVLLLPFVLTSAGVRANGEVHTAPTQDTPQASTTSLFDREQRIPIDRLLLLRGGSDLTKISSDQRLSGTVGDNRATNIVTGANSITAGAFALATGIPIVIQNSGANVLIQNATIINLQLQ